MRSTWDFPYRCHLQWQLLVATWNKTRHDKSQTLLTFIFQRQTADVTCSSSSRPTWIHRVNIISRTSTRSDPASEHGYYHDILAKISSVLVLVESLECWTALCKGARYKYPSTFSNPPTYFHFKTVFMIQWFVTWRMALLPLTQPAWLARCTVCNTSCLPSSMKFSF